MGHLRSFGGHLVTRKLKLIWAIDIFHGPKCDLVRRLCFQVAMGHLRSFKGHLVTQNSNLKNPEKDMWNAPK